MEFFLKLPSWKIRLIGGIQTDGSEMNTPLNDDDEW